MKKFIIPLATGFIVLGYLMQANPPSASGADGGTPVQVVSSDIKIKRLWKKAVNPSEFKKKDPMDTDIEMAYIQAEPDRLANLVEGQTVQFEIPQTQKTYQGVVESQYKQFDGKVSVSKGRLEDGDELTSFMLTRGPDTTVVMVVTDDGVYQIEIDNQTGQGTVIDDRALDAFRQHNDSILTPPEGLS